MGSYDTRAFQRTALISFSLYLPVCASHPLVVQRHTPVENCARSCLFYHTVLKGEEAREGQRKASLLGRVFGDDLYDGLRRRHLGSFPTRQAPRHVRQRLDRPSGGFLCQGFSTGVGPPLLIYAIHTVCRRLCLFCFC